MADSDLATFQYALKNMNQIIKLEVENYYFNSGKKTSFESFRNNLECHLSKCRLKIEDLIQAETLDDYSLFMFENIQKRINLAYETERVDSVRRLPVYIQDQIDYLDSKYSF